MQKGFLLGSGSAKGNPLATDEASKQPPRTLKWKTLCPAWQSATVPENALVDDIILHSGIPNGLMGGVDDQWNFWRTYLCALMPSDGGHFEREMSTMLAKLVVASDPTACVMSHVEITTRLRTFDSLADVVREMEQDTLPEGCTVDS